MIHYSSDCIETYKNIWRRNADSFEKSNEIRRQQALNKSHMLGELLCHSFAASRVTLVGSANISGRFNERSDIDLVVQGMPEQNYFSAVAACMNDEFEVDVIPYENVNERMLQALKTGVVVYEI